MLGKFISVGKMVHIVIGIKSESAYRVISLNKTEGTVKFQILPAGSLKIAWEEEGQHVNIKNLMPRIIEIIELKDDMENVFDRVFGVL